MYFQVSQGVVNYRHIPQQNVTKILDSIFTFHIWNMPNWYLHIIIATFQLFIIIKVPHLKSMMNTISIAEYCSFSFSIPCDNSKKKKVKIKILTNRCKFINLLISIGTSTATAQKRKLGKVISEVAETSRSHLILFNIELLHLQVEIYM